MYQIPSQHHKASKMRATVLVKRLVLLHSNPNNYMHMS